jgi:hypothetical protein
MGLLRIFCSGTTGHVHMYHFRSNRNFLLVFKNILVTTYIFESVDSLTKVKKKIEKQLSIPEFLRSLSDFMNTIKKNPAS